MPQEIDFTPPERVTIRRGDPVPPPKVQLPGYLTAPPSLDSVAKGKKRPVGAGGWNW